jgi:hypothetical protein
MMKAFPLSLRPFLAIPAALPAVAALTLGLSARAQDGRKVDFFRDVQPIFKASCYGCHGPEQQVAGLRLDSRAAFFKGGASGKTLLPGHAKDSLLQTKCEGTAKGLRMPPNAAPLSREAAETIRLWIDQGADWPEKPSSGPGNHWAYAPVKRPPVPAVKGKAWVRNPIDAFVLARLEREGLKPSPDAPKAVLLRRLSLDLTGLPPTVAEVDAFLADPRPDAYERVVDRLLASPHFGERWARPWLDLARYADTNGYEKDGRRSVWMYRDWVIGALNRNVPFDEFTIEQIAGDMLPRPTLSQRIATGFHRNTLLNEEGGVDRDEQRWLTLVDRVGTTATVWLGSTLACAQCHDHKYDPFTQADFYKFLAFFETADEPALKVPSPGQKAQQKSLEAEIARLKARAESPALSKADAAVVKARVPVLEERLNNLPIPTTLVMEERPGAGTPSTYLRVKGSFLNKAEKVTADIPSFLPPRTAGEPRSRLGLAKWLVDRRNPLTARVAVNRFWEALFGRGIVATSEDFGTRAEPPTHPDLLDWLASEFREDWDVKALIRRVVTSSTYRQSSKGTPPLQERDPENRLLARGPRFRMEAEMIRDVALAASGLLSPKIGGPSVFPPQPDGIWNVPYSGDEWVTSAGEDRYRRGLYTFLRRSAPYPSFLTFDATSREFCTVRRGRTDTPLQALTTLNDEAFFEAARALARRMAKEGGADARSRLSYGFRRCVSRRPSARELARLEALYRQYLAQYARDPEAAKGVCGSDEGNAEWAARTMAGNVLLNLDETLTKE